MGLLEGPPGTQPVGLLGAAPGTQPVGLLGAAPGTQPVLASWGTLGVLPVLASWGTLGVLPVLASWGTLGVLLVLASCAPLGVAEPGASPPLRSELERSGARATAPRGLRVQLTFGEEADLDLFVTDPLQETTYFANSPSRSGGRLEADLRCGDAAPRIETVTFDAPLPGPYRVGVDFPRRCTRRSEPVAFVVRFEHGDRRAEAHGTLALGEFQPVVLEFEVGDTPRPPFGGSP